MRAAFREDWTDGTAGEWSVPGDGVKPEDQLIDFKSPLELKNFVPPPGIELAGNYHIVKGGVVIEGGPPGVGKSRGLLALAVSGATGNEWFGYAVHRKFKTLIVQTENGEFRLSRDFAQLDCNALENFIRICPPPPYGLCFQRDDFRKQLAAAIAEFKPDLVGFDPWNAAAREQDSKEYLDTFGALKSVLPSGEDAPALIIVAHTRKPKSDERASGRALLNLLAGSYVLGSVPRTVFIMQPASDDVNDNRVVLTCCKNNDGELGSRSAWERRNGLFVPVEFFDFDAFDHPPKEKRGLKPEILREFLIKGREYDKSQIVTIVMDETGCQKSTAYNLVRAAVKKGVLRYHKMTKIYELT
jgi:AAA domain